jgi:hypothetical protein
MKSLCCLLLLSAFSYASDPLVQTWDGKPLSTNTETLHVQGAPIVVRFIQTTDHPMGCTRPIGDCGNDDTFSFLIQVGPQATNCHRWFARILKMETADPAATPYPYLELVSQAGEILTDEGVWIFPVGTITCNGSLDWNNL